MNLVDQIEAKEMKKDVADVHIGDTARGICASSREKKSVFR